MIERIQSGEPGLELVLGGGIPEHSIVLLAGRPGTGKTMLGQQYLFRNATAERPGLYVTTATEPLDKVVRFGQELAFFDKSAVGTRVIYENIGDTLAADGLPGALDRLVALLVTLRPGVLVIDSVKAFSSYASDPLEHRRFLTELAGRLGVVPTTSFWVGEYDEDEVSLAAEAAVADAIIALTVAQRDDRALRFLQVLKLRGGSFLSGRHAYRLTAGGMRVFPRLADPGDPADPVPLGDRVSLGSAGLDALVDGGVWSGTSTLVIGPSGAGKTMLALDFLVAGAQAGRTGLFATLQESPTQFARMFSDGGREGLDERIVFHHQTPVDLYVDEWVDGLFEAIDASGAKLLVVDSLSDLRLAVPDEKRFEEYVYSLAQRCGRRGITTCMTLESRPTFSLADHATTALSNLADNIILLGFQLDGTVVRRLIHVLKSRASDHDPGVFELSITPAGLRVERAPSDGHGKEREPAAPAET